MKLKVIDFQERVNNTLRGFIKVYLPDYGIMIPGFSLHEKNGHRWVEVPGKMVTQPEKDPKWEKIFSFYNSLCEKQFKEAVLVALDKFFSEPFFD